MELARVMARRSANWSPRAPYRSRTTISRRLNTTPSWRRLQSLEKAIDVQRANIAAAQSNCGAPRKDAELLRGAGAVRRRDHAAQRGRRRAGELRQHAALSNRADGHAANLRQRAAGLRRFHQDRPARGPDGFQPARPPIQGQVARTANALDPSSRTLLVEVQVPNADDALLPGMYAQVELRSVRADAAAAGPERRHDRSRRGAQVAVVGPDRTVHLQKIEVGRDYGDRWRSSTDCAKETPSFPIPATPCVKASKLTWFPLTQTEGSGPPVTVRSYGSAQPSCYHENQSILLATSPRVPAYASSPVTVNQRCRVPRS